MNVELRTFSIGGTVGIICGILTIMIVWTVNGSLLNLAIALTIFILFLTIFLIDYHLQATFFIVTVPAIIYLGERGFVPFNWSELIIYSMLLILVLESILILTRKNIKSKLFLPAFLFIWWTLVLSILHSPNLHAGIASFIVHNKYLMLLFIMPLFVDNRKRIEHLLFLIILFGFITSITGFYLLSQGAGVAGLFGLGGVKKAVSFFPNPNMLGVYLASLIPITMVYWLRDRINLKNIFLTISIVAPFLALVLLTYSRRAWIGLLAGILILAWQIKSRKIRIISLLIFVALSLTLFFGLGYETFWLRIETIFDPDYPSQAKRLDALYSLSQILTSNLSHFVYGLGAGSYGPGSFLTQQPKLIDNYFLLLWVEYGIIGLFLYLSIFVALILEIRRLRKVDAKIRYLASGILAGAVVIFISGLVGTNPITSPTNLYLWVFLGLLVSINNIKMGSGNDEEKQETKNTIPL